MGLVTRAGVAAAIAAAQVGLAYRFALAYRARAGYPRRFPPTILPTDVGLQYETLAVRSGDVELPAWFIPARSGEAGPGVVLIHGWESARDRTLPLALFLHAAGFHCLTIDIRGHGANPAEELPLSAGEFGLDAAGGVRGAARPARGDCRRRRGPLDGRRSGRSSRQPPIRASRPWSRPRRRPTRIASPARRSASLACPSRIRSPIRWPG